MNTIDIVGSFAGIETDIDYVQSLVAQGGPSEHDYHGLTAWLADIHSRLVKGALSSDDILRIRLAFGETLTPQTMQGFTLQKPHGYAGDFEIMERIYQRYVCHDQRMARWDIYWQSHPAAVAVRNRKDYFHRMLSGLSERTTSPHVLKIASGPGRSMYEWMRANPDVGIRFDCVEIDPAAIAYASALNRRFGERVRFFQRNALRFTPEAVYDLVWAAGIFDYFNNDLFVAVLRRLLMGVAPDGELVIGNFSTHNPSRPYMELLDWILYHRDDDHLCDLARRAGVHPSRISIGRESEGINLFLHIRRGAQHLDRDFPNGELQG